MYSVIKDGVKFVLSSTGWGGFNLSGGQFDRVKSIDSQVHF